MRAQSFLAAALIIVVLPLLAIPKHADATDKMIYWSGMTGISRANLDGTGTQQLVTTPGDSWGLAIDSSVGKMYWSECNSGKIRRSNLDGSQAEDVLTGLSVPSDIVLDTSAGKMYWTDQYGIKCANFDGSNLHSIYDGYIVSIALDSLSNKIYWTAYNNGHGDKISRSNLDGSQEEDVLTGVDHSWDIALDTTAAKMYWLMEDSILWANLDGSDQQHLQFGGALCVSGLTLDPSEGKMYFWREMSEGGTSIQRANLDGSCVESVVSNTVAWSIAIGPVPEPCTLLLLGLGAAIARKSRS